MKDLDIENRLLLARPSSDRYSQFTDLVMQEIKRHETFSNAVRITNKQTIRSLFMRFIKLHRAIAIVIIILAVASISFTSYAYAIGTNPVSLIRRWVSGDHVNVEYKGRMFQHGSKRTYSDAAITAFAELDTVDLLHFKANNAFQIPKNGIEHVSNPYDPTYIYPWAGTIEKYDETSVYIRKQYTLGDKVTTSTPEDTLISLPKQSMLFYVEGEPADSTASVGKVVEVFQDKFLEHKSGSGTPPQPINQFFVFQLTHTLDEIKEATQATQAGQKGTTEANMGLFETSWGDSSDICLNNGADKCDKDKQGGSGGEGLYNTGPGEQGEIGPQIHNNRNAIPFGEALLDSTQGPKDLLIRNTQGNITEITPDHIVIKSSSGTLWTLAYTVAQQKDFSKFGHKPLKVGDMLVASLIGSVNNLDARQFDDQHIYDIQRY